MVTIAPVGIFSLLGITFYLGARRVAQGRAATSVRDSVADTSIATLQGQSSGRSTSSSRAAAATVPQKPATRSMAWWRRNSGISVADEPRRRESRSAAEVEYEREDAEDTSVSFDVLAVGANRSRLGVSDDATGTPSVAGTKTARRKSLRSVWKAGPGDESNPEQVINECRGRGGNIFQVTLECLWLGIEK